MFSCILKVYATDALNAVLKRQMLRWDTPGVDLTAQKNSCSFWKFLTHVFLVSNIWVLVQISPTYWKFTRALIIDSDCSQLLYLKWYRLLFIVVCFEWSNLFLAWLKHLKLDSRTIKSSNYVHFTKFLKCLLHRSKRTITHVHRPIIVRPVCDETVY